MKFPLPALLGALLLASAANAQEAPVAARMDLWCGTAFEVLTDGAPAGATPEQLAAAKIYADAGTRLIDRAVPVYLESGYTDEALRDLRDEIEKTVRAGLDGTADTAAPAYSFEDCASLIDKGKDGQ